MNDSSRLFQFLENKASSIAGIIENFIFVIKNYIFVIKNYIFVIKNNFFVIKN